MRLPLASRGALLMPSGSREPARVDTVQPDVLIVGQGSAEGERKEPAAECEAGVVSLAPDVVFPGIRGVVGGSEVEEAGASWLSGSGVRSVLHGDQPHHTRRQQPRFLGDLPKHRFVWFFAGLHPARGYLGSCFRHAHMVEDQ